MQANPRLDPQQQEQAERIYQTLLKDAQTDLRGIAELLASKPDHQGAIGQALQWRGLGGSAKLDWTAGQMARPCRWIS